MKITSSSISHCRPPKGILMSRDTAVFAEQSTDASPLLARPLKLPASVDGLLALAMPIYAVQCP